MSATTITEEDLARVLKPTRGAPPTQQVRVLHAMLLAFGGDTGRMPNLAELARQLGVRRQVISGAVTLLKKKGVLEVRYITEPVQTERMVRMVWVHLPSDEQLQLPFHVAA